jgi:hypothetical protein
VVGLLAERFVDEPHGEREPAGIGRLARQGEQALGAGRAELGEALGEVGVFRCRRRTAGRNVTGGAAAGRQQIVAFLVRRRLGAPSGGELRVGLVALLAAPRGEFGQLGAIFGGRRDVRGR